MAVLVTTRLLPVFKSNGFMPYPQLIFSCPALDRWPWRHYYISSGVRRRVLVRRAFRSSHRAHMPRLSPAYSLFLVLLYVESTAPAVLRALCVEMD